MIPSDTHQQDRNGMKPDSHLDLGFEHDMPGITGDIEMVSPRDEQLAELRRRIQSARTVMQLLVDKATAEGKSPAEVAAEVDAGVVDIVETAERDLKEGASSENAVEAAIVGISRIADKGESPTVAEALAHLPDTVLRPALQAFEGVDDDNGEIIDVGDTQLSRDELIELLDRDGKVSIGVIRQAIDNLTKADFDIDRWCDDPEPTEDEKKALALIDALAIHFKDVEPDDAYEVANALLDRGGKEIVTHGIWRGNDGLPREAVAKALFDHELYAEVVYNLDYFQEIDRGELFQSALRAGDDVALACHLDKFDVSEGELRQLVQSLQENDGMFAIIDNIDKFPFVDATELAQECIADGLDYLLTNNDFLRRADIERLRPALMALNNNLIYLEYLDLFPEVPIESIVEELLDAGLAHNLVKKIGSHPYITAERIYDGLRERGDGANILACLTYLPEVDIPEAIELALRQSPPPTDELLYVLNKHGEGIDRRDVITRIILANADGGLYSYTTGKNQSGLDDDELYNIYLDNSKYANLLAIYSVHPKAFPGRDASQLDAKIVELFNRPELDLSEGEFTTLNEYLVEKLPPSQLPESIKLTNRYMRFCGATVEGFTAVRALSAGQDIPEAARQIGVTETGVKGLEQFGNGVRSAAGDLIGVRMGDDTLRRIRDSKLYSGILEKVYRVDVAQFGDTSEEGVRKLLEYYMEADQDGRIAPLNPAFEVARDSISLIDDGEASRAEISQDVKERYGILTQDIAAASEALKTKRPFSILLQELGDGIKAEITEISAALAETGHGDPGDRSQIFRRQNLERKSDALRGLMRSVAGGKFVGRNFVLRSPADLSAVFSELEPFESLHPTMRRIVFAWALRKNPHMVETLDTISAADPTIEDIGAVRGFVEQIVNRETFGNYFSNKKVAQRFKKLTSVRALDEALVRHQSEGVATGRQVLSIIPTRGFAAELSGHVSDACWASKYPSITEKFPNITPIIFKRGEENSPTERLVGGAVLIETKDEQGDGVLLLRGVNPIENFVNKVKVDEFYRIVTDYCREVAGKLGLRPAIVIDSQAGRAGTNREAFHEYTAKLKPQLEKIVVDTELSHFNGYDVSQTSYAL